MPGPIYRQGTGRTQEDPYEPVCVERGLRWPAGVSRRLAGFTGVQLRDLIYWPDGDPSRENSLAFGLELLAESVVPPPDNLIPLMPVDARSIACAACVAQSDWEEGGSFGPAPSEVVRWHLGLVPDHIQGELLDTDAGDFLESIASEMSRRAQAFERIMSVARGYKDAYVVPERRPRPHVVRPIQVACQNVIIGLATVQHEAAFDGLRVEDYLTCEAPHLAAHEGDRALLALILCDAFHSGGTMEVRFGPQHREQDVPPALQRYARTLDLQIGQDDPHSISPNEARRLFMAVTPMSDGLFARCETLFDRGLLTPERVCYTLMSGVFRAVELEYILATSLRASSILSGGAEAWERSARLPELETCRAALMVGTLVQRASSQDKAAGGADGVRIFEDACRAPRVKIFEDEGAVAISGGSTIGWRGVPVEKSEGPLIVLPRGLPVPEDLETINALTKEYPGTYVALLVPTDTAEFVPSSLPMLLFPDRLADLDAQINRRLRSLKIGRA